MTKNELLEMLKDVPGDYQVIMSKDSEGNAFSPLSNTGCAMYVSTAPWNGEVHGEDDAGEHYKENAVVLWPTN